MAAMIKIMGMGDPRISEDESGQSHPGSLQAAIALVNLRAGDMAENDGHNRHRKQEQTEDSRDQTSEGLSAGFAGFNGRCHLRGSGFRLNGSRSAAPIAKLAALLK